MKFNETQRSARSNSPPATLTWVVVRTGISCDASASSAAATAPTSAIQRELPRLPVDQQKIVVEVCATPNSPPNASPSSKNSSRSEWLKLSATDWKSAEHLGLRAATGEIVILVDGDRLKCVDDLDLFAEMAQRHPWVTGAALQTTGNWLARGRRLLVNGMARWLVGTRVPDIACCVVAMQRSMWRRVLNQPSPGMVALRPDDALTLRIGRASWAQLAGEKPITVPIRTDEPASPFTGAVGYLPLVMLVLTLFRFVWATRAFPRHDRVPTGSPLTLKQRSQQSLTTLLIVAAFGALMLSGLNFSLVEPDETRNVQIAIEMATSGDFVLPTRHGDPYLDKPAMLFWTIATAFRTFGISPGVARLPVALACWGTLVALIVVGAGRFGHAAGRVGALLLFACIGFALVGRFVITDALLTCWITWAALSLHRGVGPGAWKPVWWLVAGIALGLGVLTKGPVAPVLVLPPFLLWCWLERALKPRDLLNALWIIIPMIAIPLPWFLSIAMREPAQLEHFFWKHNVMRFTQAFDHQQGWWFYIPVIFAGMFPTSLLLPSAAIYLSSRLETLRRMRTRNEGYLLLCAAWTIGFFSCSSAKLPTYILPALPPLALLLARFVTRVLLSRSGARGELQQGYHRHLSRWLPWQIAPVMVVIAIAAGIVEADLVNSLTQIDWIQWTAMSVGLVAVYLIVRLWRGGFAAKWGMLGASLPMAVGYILLDVYGDGATYRSYFPEAIAAVASYDATLPDDQQPPIVWFGRLGDSTHMYLGESPEHHFGESQVRQLVEFAANRRETVVVAIPRHAKLIEERMPLDFQLEPIVADGLLWRLTRVRRDLPTMNATRMAETPNNLEPDNHR